MKLAQPRAATPRLAVLNWIRRQRDDRPYLLYKATVEQARQPALYQRFGVQDTLDGRFEMILLHMALVLGRLREEGGSLRPVGQAMFDVFLADMDQNLRQMGVGDMTVPKRMKKMGEAFYGRYHAYAAAQDEAALGAAILRNVFADAGPQHAELAAGLAHYAMAVRAALLGQLVADVERGAIAWPDPDMAGLETQR